MGCGTSTRASRSGLQLCLARVREQRMDTGSARGRGERPAWRPPFWIGILLWRHLEREQQRWQQQRVLPEDQRWGHEERFGRARQRLLLPQLRGRAAPSKQRWAQLRWPHPSAEQRVL